MVLTEPQKIRKLIKQVYSESLLSTSMLVFRNNLNYIILAKLQRFLKMSEVKTINVLWFSINMFLDPFFKEYLKEKPNLENH